MTVNNEKPQQFDIVVVGAGLVGAAFACYINTLNDARYPLKIAVVDPAPSPKMANSVAVPASFDPRVVALTEKSRQLLSDSHIWHEAVATKACAYFQMEVRDSQGTGFVAFDCADVHQADLGHIVENSVIVTAAHHCLHNTPAITFIPQGVAQITEQDQGTLLALNDGQTLVTPLLVAADGANSMVRERLGFGTRSWNYAHTALVTTITTEQPHQHTACQWFGREGPLAFLPLITEKGDCHYSSIVWSQTPEENERLMSLSDEAFCAELSVASERRFGSISATAKRFSFPLMQRHARDYIQAHVALIGDAAHSIHPLAGQGVNLGFADARVLAEEVLRGLERGLPVGHISSLGRYQRRRKPENLAMMAAMEGLKRLFAGNDPALSVLRNRGMAGFNRFSGIKNQLIKKAMGF